MPEVGPAIAETFTDLKDSDPLVIGCGDDRAATEASLKYLTSQGIPVEAAFGRIFGGVYGLANAALITLAIQRGPVAMRQELGASFKDYAGRFAEAARPHNFYLLTHSSTDAEGDHAHLNEDSPNPLACARAVGLGPVNHLCGANQLVIAEAEAESVSLFGRTPSNRSFDRVISGVNAVRETLGDDATISRGDVISTGLGAMVLDGAHALTGQVDHVVNLRTDKISNPSQANNRGVFYYDSDLTQAARIILKTKPDYQLDPLILLDVLILDEVATRAALAKSTGGQAYDPRLIRSYRYGDPTAALDYLASV